MNNILLIVKLIVAILSFFTSEAFMKIWNAIKWALRKLHFIQEVLLEPPVIKEFTTIGDAATYFVHISGKHPRWAYAIYANAKLSMYYVIKARDYHHLPSDHPILTSRLVAAADLTVLRELAARFPSDLFAEDGKFVPLPPQTANPKPGPEEPNQSNDNNS